MVGRFGFWWEILWSCGADLVRFDGGGFDKGGDRGFGDGVEMKQLSKILNNQAWSLVFATPQYALKIAIFSSRKTLYLWAFSAFFCIIFYRFDTTKNRVYIVSVR